VNIERPTSKKAAQRFSNILKATPGSWLQFIPHFMRGQDDNLVSFACRDSQKWPPQAFLSSKFNVDEFVKSRIHRFYVLGLRC